MFNHLKKVLNKRYLNVYNFDICIVCSHLFGEKVHTQSLEAILKVKTACTTAIEEE